MRDKFQTIEEARAFRYGKWAGFPQGNAYREGFCAEQVHSGDRGGHSYQCQRKVADGRLYCGQHKPGAAEARREEAHERYERERKQARDWHKRESLRTAAELLRAEGESEAADECEALARRVMGDRT